MQKVEARDTFDFHQNHLAQGTSQNQINFCKGRLPSLLEQFEILSEVKLKGELFALVASKDVRSLWFTGIL